MIEDALEFQEVEDLGTYVRDICCQPIKKGGLVLRRLVTQNISFLMKLAHQIVTNPEALWVKRSISNIWDQFRKNLYWSLGNGSSISFIQDTWIPKLGPLHSHLSPDVVILVVLKVANFLDPDGCWKCSLLERYFNRELFEHIATCHPPNDTLAECVSRFFSLDLAEWVNSNLIGVFQVGLVIEKVEEMVSSTKCFAEHVIETSLKIDMERWCLPNHGWIKINTDGVASRNKNWLAAGGLLRDSFGNWIEGFQRYVKRGFAVNSELWAILHRLEIAETRGYTKVIVEFDCMGVVDMIKECSESTPSMTIVRKIKEVTR
ncbi:hypothetical protein Godav_022307 [Gossypium davidsonii]|uniref:RNase H type-1 domain-containing protein n=1 Tax=Gossypium davidsonii TaxID=34287 RepID=A0A7J8TD90_GOSDV|nr:hypothetical protein [Gossypium davidsonii]